MLNPDLYKKYNVPGPRYTSYPTVPYWENSPTESQWVQALSESLKKSEADQIGAALYVHIPFCQSLCTYCGCNTRITRNHSVGAPYIETLLQEWNLYQQKLERTRGSIKVSEIHLGGGTPTFLTPPELEKLLSSLLNEMSISRNSEFSIEADPRVTTLEHLKVLNKMGFKRLSLGIQDFDLKVQKTVNREQSPEMVKAVVSQARDLGFTSINFDLIYGLPFQTLESVRGTVEKVKELRPDRIAFYAYAHVPWIKPSQRRFTENDLPAAEAKRALYELGRSLLEEAGYIEIGMDHFALKTDSLYEAVQSKTLHRNFMGYISRQVSPLIGIGVSAIGDAWSAFAQNEKVLETYQTRVAAGQLPLHRGHLLTQEDQLIRRYILNLMTNYEVNWKNETEMPELTEILSQLPDRLTELKNDGLIELGNDWCKVNEGGRAFLRNICMAFDARLIRKSPQNRLFSSTV